MFKKDAEYFAEGSKEFYQRLILGILETFSWSDTFRDGVKFLQLNGDKII